MAGQKQTLYAHGAGCVENSEKQDADVAEDGKPHAGDAECAENQDQDLDADGEIDVFVGDAEGLARNADGKRERGEFVVHDDDVRGLDGRIRTEGAHCNSNVRAHEDRGVVDAVADEGRDDALLDGVLNNSDFFAGEKVRIGGRQGRGRRCGNGGIGGNGRGLGG